MDAEAKKSYENGQLMEGPRISIMLWDILRSSYTRNIRG